MTPLEDVLLDELESVATRSHADPLDVLIIGGGATGLTATRVLAEAGCKVAVLEAGPFQLMTHAAATDLRFSPGAVQALQRQLSYSPGAVGGPMFGSLVSCLGGRGVFWNGAAPRSLKADFAEWPLRADELEPNYQWAEREMFVSPAWGQTELARKMIRLLRKGGFAAKPEPFAIAAGASRNGYLRGAIGNPMTILLRSGLFEAGAPNRPRVVVDARADLLTIGAPAEPIAVRVVNQTSREAATVQAKTVVLAAGGFESVRLALASRLPDESGLLGRRLSDHWFVRAYFPLPPGFFDPSSPQAGAAIVRSSARRAYQLEFHAPGRRFFTAEWPWRPAPTEEYSVMVRAFAPVVARDSSRVELLPDQGLGHYQVRFAPEEPDERLVQEMKRAVAGAGVALGAMEAKIEVLPLGSSYHEAGGMQMSDSPTVGVVDPFGRLWSEPRIRVFDAAAWPAIGATNPHLTLVAIAHRQAQALANDIRVGRT